MPMPGLLGRVMGKKQAQAAIATDARVNIMNDIIGSIRTVKANCWEYFFKQKIGKARRSLRKSEKLILMTYNRVYCHLQKRT